MGLHARERTCEKSKIKRNVTVQIHQIRPLCRRSTIGKRGSKPPIVSPVSMVPLLHSVHLTIHFGAFGKLKHDLCGSRSGGLERIRSPKIFLPLLVHKFIIVGILLLLLMDITVLDLQFLVYLIFIY